MRRGPGRLDEEGGSRAAWRLDGGAKALTKEAKGYSKKITLYYGLL